MFPLFAQGFRAAMPLGSRWAVQEPCLLAEEIDVAVTAAERENPERPLGLYLFINKRECSPAGGGYSFLAPKDC